MPTELWPTTREGILEWAFARVDVHLPVQKEEEIKEFLDSPQRIGSADELDDDKMRRMCRSAIELHLDEVERCVATGGGPNLESWRRGAARPEWPAPDGFPPEWATTPCGTGIGRGYIAGSMGNR